MISFDRKKVEIILNWCKKKFKRSKYIKKYPKLRVYKSKGSSYYSTLSIQGYYSSDTNTISIFTGTISSLKELCNIVLHEYKHYLLDSDEHEILYNLYEQQYDHEEIFNKHPHEIKCRKFAKKWENECYKEIQKLTKINK